MVSIKGISEQAEITHSWLSVRGGRVRSVSDMTHVYTHCAECFLLAVSRGRGAASNQQRRLCGVYPCAFISLGPQCLPLCGLASSARVWIIISMCQNFVGMRLVMHSYLTAITHCCFALSLPACQQERDKPLYLICNRTAGPWKDDSAGEAFHKSRYCVVWTLLACLVYQAQTSQSVLLTEFSRRAL